MKKTALSFGKSETRFDESTRTDRLSECTITRADLSRYAQDWLSDCEYRQHSKQTLAIRRFCVEKLLWYLEREKRQECGVTELRNFFVYASRAHEDKDGRWGNASNKRPVKARTLHTYHNHLRTLFSWLAAEQIIRSSPMERIAPPVARTDQIQPFNSEQITALIQAARRSQHPKRDEAIVRFLLDTGVRVSELCALKMGDFDLAGRRCTILGKGNKRRSIFFGRKTARALSAYLRTQSWEDNQPVFIADRGMRAGEPLTRSGLLHLIRRLGKDAGLKAVRCSPHTFRHTFAMIFLREGGNTFSLMQMLGHTTLDMTKRYSALAQADIENQHRQFSPGDRF